MTRKYWARFFWGILFVVSVAARIFAKSAPDSAYYENARPAVLVIAHQGGEGIFPGDTLYAYDRAAAMGADVMEMDAHITKDGAIVLMHDEKVDRTTDGSGLIEDMTLADLKKLDAAYQWSNDGGQTFPFRGKGIQVPTLNELFEKIPDKRYLIEIKLTKNPIQKPFCELIHKYHMEQKVIVASFHDDAMSAFRQACPDIATSAAKLEVAKFVLFGKVFLSGWVSPLYQSLQVPYETSESYGIPVMTARFIREAHTKNVKVEPWTVDDPALMKQYIEWGVDGIITDRPDLMLKLLGR